MRVPCIVHSYMKKLVLLDRWMPASCSISLITGLIRMEAPVSCVPVRPYASPSWIWTSRLTRASHQPIQSPPSGGRTDRAPAGRARAPARAERASRQDACHATVRPDQRGAARRRHCRHPCACRTRARGRRAWVRSKRRTRQR